jgi:hypothetical protein
MPSVNQQSSAEQKAKVGSVTGRRLRRVAYLSAMLFITVTVYAMKEARPETNAARSLPATLKMPGANIDVVVCSATVSMEQAEDFDQTHPKFRINITSSSCTGSGVASVEGGGFITFPNNGSCVQAQADWTASAKWKNSSGSQIGTSDLSGSVVLVYTGDTGLITTAFTGSVTEGKFAGATVGTTLNSVDIQPTCIVVGNIQDAFLSGLGSAIGL